jgi:hypothetical protein
MIEGKIFGYGKAKDWQSKKPIQAKPKQDTNKDLAKYLGIDWVA